jgi:DNA-binding GntR family transcriptional regulator
MDVNVRVTMKEINSVEIQHNTLSNLVLNKLMDWIMDGKLHMGEKLNTEELATQFNVSRMPIREALNNLEKIGLAESIPYVGTRLVSLTKEDVRQIYIASSALEPIVGSYA